MSNEEQNPPLQQAHVIGSAIIDVEFTGLDNSTSIIAPNVLGLCDVALVKTLHNS